MEHKINKLSGYIRMFKDWNMSQIKWDLNEYKCRDIYKRGQYGCKFMKMDFNVGASFDFHFQVSEV